MESDKIIKFIEELLMSDERFKNFIESSFIKLNKKDLLKIKSILGYMIAKINSDIPISQIISEINEIISDGKIELYEIPKLIKSIYTSVEKLDNTIIIKSDDIGILIKIILFILIETNTIKLSNVQTSIISDIIDTSVELLNTQFIIKKPSNLNNKCICWKKN